MIVNSPVNNNGDLQGRRLHKTLRRIGKVLAVLSVVYVLLYGISTLLLKQAVQNYVNQTMGAGAGELTLGADVNPFGLAIRAAQLDYTSAIDSGTFKDVAIGIPFFAPWQVLTELDLLTYKNARVDFATGDVKIALKYTGNKFMYKSTLQDVAVKSPQMIDNGLSLKVKTISVDYTRRLGAHDQAQPEDETRFVAETIDLPVPPAENGTAAPSVERLEWRLTAEPALPRDMRNRAAVQDWQAAGGQVTIAPLSIDVLGLNASLSGPVMLNDKLEPTGKLKVTVVGIDKAYTALGSYNEQYRMMKPEQYQMLGMLLQMAPQAASGAMEFPLTIDNKMITFINSPIFPIGNLPWDIVPQAIDDAVEKALPGDQAPIPTPNMSLPVPATPTE